MAVKKYLDFEGLTYYDAKIKEFAEGLCNDVISKIIADAPETFDTLAEISAYIAEHTNEYNALVALTGDKAAASDLTAAVARISTLEASVLTLKADEVTEGSIAYVVAQAIAETKGYTDDEITEITNGAIATLASNVETNTSAISEIDTRIKVLEAATLEALSAEEIATLFITSQDSGEDTETTDSDTVTV